MSGVRATRIFPEKIDRMLRTLITRSSGSLRELRVSCVNDDDMFRFIAEHVESLQTLIIKRSGISDSTVARVASKLSSLTTLNMSHSFLVSTYALEAIVRNCKNLSSLTWSSRCMRFPMYDSTQADEVLTIAQTMPKLKHLSIPDLDIKTPDVLEILSGCPELESLDVQGCLDVSLDSKLLEEKYPKLKLVDDELDQEWFDGLNDGRSDSFTVTFSDGRSFTAW